MQISHYLGLLGGLLLSVGLYLQARSVLGENGKFFGMLLKLVALGLLLVLFYQETSTTGDIPWKSLGLFLLSAFGTLGLLALARKKPLR